MSVDILPEPFRHDFTPDEEPRDMETIQPLLDRLEAMPVDTRDELEAFLAAWNEFDAWVGDHLSRSVVATRSHTDDEQARDHFMHLVSNVIPTLQAFDDRLGRKLLASPALEALEDSKFAPFIRQVRVSVELFREENIPLNQKLTELVQRYEEISGGWTVEFDGEEYTVSGMRKFLSSPERDVRRRAWEAMAEMRRETSDSLEDLFDQLFEHRNQVALNAGFDGFREYVFRQKMRDYGPEECFAFHEIVEAEVVPLAREVAEWTASKLGLDSIRPWDESADPEGLEPLEPFEHAEELKDGVERMMRRLDPTLGDAFAGIRDNMDLDSRKNKAQGGFMTRFDWARRPFIFANASGVHSDVNTLLHESGHAFHYLLSQDNMPMHGVSIPMEFNEVASMAMELLAFRTFDEFYDEAERKRAMQEHLRRIPRLLTSVARGDAFQHWLYTNPDHDRAQRRQKWVEEQDRFSGYLDWSGIDAQDRENSYHAILHFFVVPFYFIEYGFAQLGALQVAVNAEKDLEGAMQAYRKALSLGATKDTFGLYQAAGAQFIPDRQKVRELMDWIRASLFD